MNAICVKNLRKSYGEREILHGISFDVKEGEVFAILGVNGAGKTTTLECLEGLKKYQADDIQVNGTRGVQLQSSSLPSAMKVKEAVELFARYKKVNVDWEMFAKLGLVDISRRNYKGLSTGQKRRLHLMIALLGNPDILFLDEPTAGLDVEARRTLHDVIRELKHAGKTIVLASHDMSEVEELSDRVVILREGDIAFLGDRESLSRLQEISTIYISCDEDISLLSLRYANFVKVTKYDYEFHSREVVKAVSELLTVCEKAGIHLSDIQIKRATLEESFLKIAKEEVV